MNVIYEGVIPEECPTTVASDPTIVEMFCGKVTLIVININILLIVIDIFTFMIINHCSQLLFTSKLTEIIMSP